MTLTRKVAFSVMSLAAVSSLVFACSSESSPPPELTGRAVLGIRTVPPDVSCIRAFARGERFERGTPFDVQPGGAASLPLEELPLGVVVFAADAFAARCSDITPTSSPTWVSKEDVAATIRRDEVTRVALVLVRPTGGAVVDVDFQSDASDGGAPVDGGAEAGDGGSDGEASAGDAGLDGADGSDVCGAMGLPCCSGPVAPCVNYDTWITCNAQNVCERCGEPGDLCCDPFYMTPCRGPSSVCHGGRCSASCGTIGEPCCVTSAACGTPPPTGPFAVCQAGMCVACGFVGQACCPENHGSSWVNGCSGAGGVSLSCQTVDGGSVCAPCGGAGQPPC